MEEDKTGNTNFTEQIKTIKSAISSSKQTLVLGISSSLNGGAAYGYIVSLDYHYFTPALAVIAGFIGGVGIAAREILSEKENNYEDIPLKNILLNALFGIIAMFLGYLLVYYFVELPSPDQHGTILSLPAELGTTADFLKATMGMEDIIGAILGSITSLALPIIFREKIRSLMKTLKISRFYSVSK